MSLTANLKELISRTAQRALGIEELRYNLRVALQTLDRLYQIEGKVAQLESVNARLETLNARVESLGAQLEALTGWAAQIKIQLFEQKNAIQNGATLLVTHSELTSRHGTGALLLKVLRGEASLALFYSHDFFKANDIDVPAIHIPHSGIQLALGSELVQRLLAKPKIQRILCVPFYEDDVRTALTAQTCTGAPLALYLMDDQNIHVNGIPDELLGRLIQRANLCVAISPALCQAYTEKYRRQFWLAPPTADPDLFVPADYRFEPQTPPRGILVGNLWSSHTLDRFRETVRLSGLQIDWCGNAGKPFITLDSDALNKEGIFLHSHLPEASLIQLARSADFAVIPTGVLDGSDTHEWLARTSLPSRIIYLMATANIPMVVMGHPLTAAAQFVTDLGLGTVCNYTADSFRTAVRELTNPTRTAQIRERARTLSPSFSSRELACWLWESLERGEAIDDRFENLVHASLNPSQTEYSLQKPS
jgi:hypothetical protein